MIESLLVGAHRALDCDESEAVCDKALGKIGRKEGLQKPPKPKRKPVSLAV